MIGKLTDQTHNTAGEREVKYALSSVTKSKSSFV